MTQKNSIQKVAEVNNVINHFMDVARTSIFDDMVLVRLAASLYSYHQTHFAKDFTDRFDDAERDAKENMRTQKVLEYVSSYIVDLESVLSQEEIDILVENYAEVIEKCFDFYSQSVISHNAEFSQPRELTRLCTEMMLFDSDTVVYNPFAGLGSFITDNPQCKFYGSEINPLTWALMQINLDAHNCEAEIDLADAFNELKDDSRKYDAVIMNPPFGLLSHDDNEFTALKYALENKLNEDGVVLTILPMSFCYSKKHQALREYLVKSGYLTGVIQLPAIFAPLTQIHTCVVVAQKKREERITFVDARNFYTRRKASRSVALNFQAVVDEIQNEDGVYQKTMDSFELTDEFNLTPSRILFKLPETSFPKRTLRELVEVVALHPFKDVTGFKLPQRLFSNKISDYKIDVTSLEVGQQRIAKTVYDNCLLLSLRGTTNFRFAKITNLSERVVDMPVMLSPDIFAFNVLPNSGITEDYLLLALQSNFVQQQVNAYSVSMGAMYSLTKEDLLSLVIPVPSLDIQEKSVKEVFATEIFSLEGKIQDELEQYKADIHMKKHNIGQTLFNLDNWWSILKNTVDSSDRYLDLNDDLDGLSSITIREMFSVVDRLLTTVKNKVSLFTVGDEFAATEKLNITSFIQKYVEVNQSPLFKFEFQTLGVEMDAEIVFNTKALTTIFDNIVHNACEHGFVNRSNNVIRFSIEKTEDEIFIFVANNGEPLHAQMSPEKVFVYGESTKFGKGNHEGLGAYAVKQIMSKLGAKVELESDPDSNFPVCYKLMFNK